MVRNGTGTLLSSKYFVMLSPLELCIRTIVSNYSGHRQITYPKRIEGEHDDEKIDEITNKHVCVQVMTDSEWRM